MKIQPITTHKNSKITFKQYDKNQDWEYDYGTYYNNITIKDAFISASIMSAICHIGTKLVTHASKIKNFAFKLIKSK